MCYRAFLPSFSPFERGVRDTSTDVLTLLTVEVGLHRTTTAEQS